MITLHNINYTEFDIIPTIAHNITSIRAFIFISLLLITTKAYLVRIMCDKNKMKGCFRKMKQPLARTKQP
ncbi:MAG: hypothetical protein LBL74_05800 [Bacteroidales bacterium]|nr:hypothetical protein [Bacteroidales bacterium]